MCGNLWMSEDGQRIFTACGNVFRASSDRKTDMTYNGSLSRLPYIQHVVHSAAAGRILAIPAARSYGQSEGALAENQLAIFGYDTLNTEKIVPLPDFIVNSKPFAAHGRFVFVNSAGTQYYVVVQADQASGLLNDFGLVVNGF
jgi:chitinase